MDRKQKLVNGYSEQRVKESAQWLSSASVFPGSRVSFLHSEMIFITFIGIQTLCEINSKFSESAVRFIESMGGRGLRKEKEDGATE